jgi:hypothetical protein
MKWEPARAEIATATAIAQCETCQVCGAANRHHYETHAQLKKELHAFLMVYNFAKRLKTLRGLRPYERICKVWTERPNRFGLDPRHRALELNASSRGCRHRNRANSKSASLVCQVASQRNLLRLILEIEHGNRAAKSRRSLKIASPGR